MWSLIASLASSASGILILLAVVASLLGLGAFEQHKIDANALTTLKAQYAQATATVIAKAAAQQKVNDDAALAAATAEAASQAQAAATLQRELSDVKAHVSTKVIPCVSYGLVRVLDAAALGVTTSSLALPAGKSDDTCTTLTADDLAVSIVNNYGAARDNADQLNALIALLKKQGITVKK